MRRVTDDDDRHQRAKQYWPIRRASNNSNESLESESLCVVLPYRLDSYNYDIVGKDVMVTE